MIDKELVHIGLIKFITSKGYGFIIDFLDNSEYYFHKSFIIIDNIQDTVVSFKVRKSHKFASKKEAYGIAHPFYYKGEIIESFSHYSKEIQEVLEYYLPSIICKEHNDFKDEVNNLLTKCEALIQDLYNYVNCFDIEEFLKSYFVKTHFYYSASTKDWDINSLSYKSYYEEPYSKLESIYRRCAHYEESLVWQQADIGLYSYSVFDRYIDDISSKSEQIKSTTAYGYDSDFWKDLNREEIESKIPEITEKWKNEIKQTYNKKDHIVYLINQIKYRFNSRVKRMPTLVDRNCEKTIYVRGKDGNNELSIYICPPRIDVMMNYSDGCIHFVGQHNEVYGRIGFEVGEGYEYRITRQLKGEEITRSNTISSVSDDDFVLFRKHFYDMRYKTRELFTEMTLKYLNF